MENIEAIVVPVDGFEGAGHALEMSAHLAQRCELPLKVAYVVPLTAESTIALAHMDKQ